MTGCQDIHCHQDTAISSYQPCSDYFFISMNQINCTYSFQLISKFILRIIASNLDLIHQHHLIFFHIFLLSETDCQVQVPAHETAKMRTRQLLEVSKSISDCLGGIRTSFPIGIILEIQAKITTAFRYRRCWGPGGPSLPYAIIITCLLRQ